MDSSNEGHFLNYLLGLGYPPGSIINQPALRSKSGRNTYRPDFAIVNQYTREPLAIIEVLGNNDVKSIKSAIRKFSIYLDDLNDQTIRGFIAIPSSDSEEGFKIYYPDKEGNEKQVSFFNSLKIESLISAKILAKGEGLFDDKQKTTNWFLIVCNIAAATAILICIADLVCSFYNITLLTTNRMSLIGLAFALVFIPFFQKFKALGIELDRVNKN